MMGTDSEGKYDTMVGSFTASVKADLDSPITSNFGNRIPEYRTEAQQIGEEIDVYTVDFERLRKVAKDVEDTLTNLTKQLLAFGQAAKEVADNWTTKLESQFESDAAVILMKMECYIRDEADLTNLQMRNWQSNIVNPFLSLVETGRDIRNRGVERSCRDYTNKYLKAESDAKKHAKHAGYTRGQVGHGELAEQLVRERLMVQYELCKFLMSVDTMEDRRGPQLLRHFMELVRNQNSYYVNRVKVNEDFRQDMTKLEERMMTRNANRCAQRNMLWDVRSQLEANDEFTRSASVRRSTGRESMNRGSIAMSNANTTLSMENDSLNELATSTAFPELDFIESGYLYKKSNKKLHKQWQKRRCRIEDGHFWLSHSDESAPPTKLSLLVSDCKPSADDPKAFDLYCRERTYHLQADSEADAKRWMLALKREIVRVKTKMLSTETFQGKERCGSVTSEDLSERKICIAKLRQLPGNDICADCSSKEDVQWLSNMGALVCIACSGVHRELGVHVSRIQSLNLDVITPLEFLVPLSSGNSMINRLFEYNATKCATWKPIPGCTRFDRQRFIQMKYRDRAFVQELDDPDISLTEAFNELDFESAYRALLSPNLTKKPFLRNGPFHQMVLRGVPLSLPLADLVMQLRIEIPDMEAIIMDCIWCGNADMVAVLLRYRSLGSIVRGIHLHSLIACSEKAQQKKITEMLRSLQSGDSMQAQITAIPSALFVWTPDSASLSRSSSSVSPCPRVPLDLTSVTSKSVNVLMRNGTTISVPPSNLSVDETGDNRPVRQVLDESGTDRSSVRRSVIRIADPVSPLLETCTHSGMQPSTSRDSDTERGLLLSEVVPLHTSTPSSNVTPTHKTVVPNHYLRAPGDIPVVSELTVSLDSAPALQTFASLSSSPIQSILATASVQKEPISHGRSASEYTRAMNYSEESGTVRSLPGHLTSQLATTAKGIDRTLGTKFRTNASISLDPIPQTQEMNAYVVAPGKETLVDKERRTVSARSDREQSGISSVKATSSSSSSSFDVARSNFMSHDEHARCSVANSSAFTGFGIKDDDNGESANESKSRLTRYPRLTRLPVSPPSPVGVRLKPPIPAPRRFPSITRENKRRDGMLRCQALYDCYADNHDELSFREGDIIVVTKEKIDGENDTWMEGYLENHPLCRGFFPTTFVKFFS